MFTVVHSVGTSCVVPVVLFCESLYSGHLYRYFLLVVLNGETERATCRTLTLLSPRLPLLDSAASSRHAGPPFSSFGRSQAFAPIVHAGRAASVHLSRRRSFLGTKHIPRVRPRAAGRVRLPWSWQLSTAGRSSTNAAPSKRDRMQRCHANPPLSSCCTCSQALGCVARAGLGFVCSSRASVLLTEEPAGVHTGRRHPFQRHRHGIRSFSSEHQRERCALALAARLVAASESLWDLWISLLHVAT